MNPIEVPSFACGNCRKVWVYREGAVRCCCCSDCGQFFDPPTTLCHPCGDRRGERRAQRINNIPESSAGDAQFVGRRDSEPNELRAVVAAAADDRMEYLEHEIACDCEECDSFAYLAEKDEARLDADDILEPILSNLDWDFHDDLYPQLDTAGLQRALDEWLKDNPIEWYELNDMVRVWTDERFAELLDALTTGLRALSGGKHD